MARIEALDKLTVLLACEDKGRQVLFRRILRGLGISAVVVANTQQAAYDSARFNKFDLIFADHGGADIDGEMFVRVIRTNDVSNKDLPLILIVSPSNEAVSDAPLSVGATAVIQLPVDAKAIYAMIRAVLDKAPNTARSTIYVGPDRRHLANRSTHVVDQRKDAGPDLIKHSISGQKLP